MKKLLAILGALGMTVSASTVVVACGQESSIKRWSSPYLQLLDVLFSLKNDPDGSLSETLGKMMNDRIDFEKTALAMVQDQTSRISNEYFKNQINDSLKLNRQEKVYQNQLDEITSNIAQNQFYLQYTNNKLTNPATSLDEILNVGLGDGNLYRLNPKNLLRNDNETGEKRKDSNQYFIYINQKGTDLWDRWQYLGENSASENYKLPTIEELEKNEFVILRKTESLQDKDVPITESDLNNKEKLFYKDSEGNPKVGDDANLSIYSKDGSSAFRMDGKSALEYRFQSYFNKQIRTNFFQNDESTTNGFFENLLTMTYLDKSFYNLSRNPQTKSQQDAFLNISSNLAQTIQSWSKTDGYQSKLKMVWSFTFKNSETLNAAWKKIQDNVVLNNDSAFNRSQTLKKVYQLLEEAQPNASELGSDPFFNFGGYNGLVKNSDDGSSITSVDGNLKISDDAKAKIARANGPSILSKNNKGQGFASDKPNEYDLILVLPIYLIDLLNDRTGGFNNGQSTTAFVTFDDLKAGKAESLYSSYSKAVLENGTKIAETKMNEVNANLDQTKDFYLYVDGIPYTVSEFNRRFNQNLPDNNTIWQNWLTSNEVTDQIGENKEVTKIIDGLQFTTPNTIESKNLFGNIGLNQWTKVGKHPIPSDTQGFEFETRSGELYVKAPNEPSLVGTVKDFGSFKLSFDDGGKDGVYTVNGTLNDQVQGLEGKTYSYKVNMGPNASNPEGYIRDGRFNYYTQNISSFDVATLSTEKKNSLLREIEYITSKEAGVSDTAAGAILPLFLNGDQVLYQPLYDKLKQYLVDEEGGTSD